MPLMQQQQIIDICRQIFIKNNASQQVATSVSQALVEAEVDEQFGHGLVRVKSYVDQLKSGKADGQAVPQIKQIKPSFYHISARGGFAYPALELAIKTIGENIQQQGIIAVGINESHHCGVAGHIVEKLAKQGMVALLLSNTPKAIAPWGGKTAVFGTNPIAFAAGDVVVDMATSVIARGKLIGAKNRGEKIPLGWAIDENGNPTDDAEKAMNGCILPFGEAKGYAIILMVEILTAVLCQATLSKDASSFLDAKGTSPNVGQLLLAIDKNILGENGFDAKMEVLLDAIQSQDGTRVPGMKRKDIRAKNKNGIEVSTELYNQLQDLLNE